MTDERNEPPPTAETLAALLHERDQLREEFPEALVEVTLNGSVTFLNKRARDLLGFGAEDVAGGLTAADIVGEEAATNAAASVARDLAALASGARQESRLAEGIIPFRFRRSDGTEGFAEGKAAYSTNASGDVTGARIVLRDATARVTFERELHRSRAEFERIFETASEGIWQFDADGRTVRANKAMAAMLGTAPATMQGKKLFQFLDEADQPASRERIERMNRGEVLPVFEARLRGVDGRTVWIRVATNPMIEERGTAGGFLALVTDITNSRQTALALAESERRFRSLFSTMQAGILLRDGEGRLVDLNPAA